MTTLYREKKQCAVCGTEQECEAIMSTNEVGSPDLDGRPAESRRSTIFAWVQRCCKCGYCAEDLSEAPSQAPVVVTSTKYKEQLADPSFPELANSFLCKAIIDENAGTYSSAAWACVHAAWVCDDAQQVESARKCRNKAVDMVIKTQQAGQKFVGQSALEIAILTDLLRRAGRFAEAKQLIASKRSQVIEGIILKMLDFQERLIARCDTACHKISEAIEETDTSK